MIGIYFSGTGNSRYVLDVFLQQYNDDSVIFSIEDEKLIEQLNNHDELIFSYPVQYSTVPKILRDFINKNSNVWNGKKVFIIATMGLFSGDGAGVLGRLLKHHGAIINIKRGKYPQEGLGILYRIAGFFGQRLWFGYKTRNYSNQLKVDKDKCVGCSKCVKICPTKNIQIKDGKAKANAKCTMCYRCINQCPKQAITLLGKKVIEQTSIEKYLK